MKEYVSPTWDFVEFSKEDSITTSVCSCDGCFLECTDECNEEGCASVCDSNCEIVG